MKYQRGDYLKNKQVYTEHEIQTQLINYLQIKVVFMNTRFKKGHVPWNKGKPSTLEARQNMSKAKSHGVTEVVCEWCKKQFVRKKSKINGTLKRRPLARLYCSRSCKGYAGFKGGNISQQGYRKIRINGKYVQEHRHIMEKYIGRKLDIKDHVHHINHIKTDNRLENLLVLDIHEHGRIEGKRNRGRII